MKYETPSLEIVLFSSKDVLCASDENETIMHRFSERIRSRNDE